MIRDFKFFKGTDDLQIQPMNNIGLLNDYLDNGITMMDYPPHELMINNVVYLSTICHRTYNEWIRLVEMDQYWDYHMIGVLRPPFHYFNGEEEIVELHGQTQVFPLFVIDNPDVEYLYEYIMVPKNN